MVLAYGFGLDFPRFWGGFLLKCSQLAEEGTWQAGLCRRWLLAEPAPPASPQRGHNAVDWRSSSRAKLCFCLPGWFDSNVQGSRFCSELPGAYEEDASMDDKLTGFILFCLITGLSPPPMRSA